MDSQLQLQLKQKLKDDFLYYAPRCLKVRTKSGHIEPFTLNKAQLYIHEQLEKQKRETGKVRALILKARQLGMSTYIGARYYHQVTFNKGIQAFILTHSLEATGNLYTMAKRFYEHTPLLEKPMVSKTNAKELVFGILDSGYKLGTAENKNVGRSSTIQLLHSSEVAFWSNAADHATGIFQAVPNSPNTEIIMESTANGVGNFFHAEWQKAESGLSDYIAIFVPWHWQLEYCEQTTSDFEWEPEELELAELYALTKEQIYWRRKKIIQLSVSGVDGVKSFKQEYPMCIVGDQRVGTSRGIIFIKDIIDGDFANTGNIKRKWQSGEKETIAIETELGYRLECTPEHLISLASGHFECASNVLDKEIKLGCPRFSESEFILYWRPLPCLESKLVVNQDIALFLGFFMGDGSYDGQTLSIAFDKRDPTSINKAKELIKKLFNKEVSERQTTANGWELRAHSRQFKPLFLQLDIIAQTNDRIKRKIHVPECIWKSPKHIIKSFLQGLFDADGFASFDCAKIAFFSKHKQFVIDIQLLLLGFGITSKRNHVEKIAGNGSIYMGNELVLRAAESRKFGAEIGFISCRKNRRVETWLDVKNLGRTGLQIKYQDKVKSIQPLGVNVVYDLEMENNPHVFDAQGIIVHNCSTEAFQLSGEDTFIDSSIVAIARATKCEGVGPLLIGCDPARFGSDRTSIIFRQGRKAWGLISYVKKDTMEITGILYKLIQLHSPAKIFIDIGGLGAGIYDRLIELGCDCVVAVNAGSSPIDAVKYKNKRAELWGELKEWLMDAPVEIPNSDELHADLCGIKYKFDSNSRLQMESKEEMKKRGLRSCDTSDALGLTFALPASALSASINKAQSIVSDALNTNFDARLRALNSTRK